MINNFSNTEKSLKRYLKEKVTITTATVVSFLIAGTVAMADAKDVTVGITTVEDSTVISTQIDGGEEQGTEIPAANLTIENWKALTGEGGALKDLVKVDVAEDGKITIAAGDGNEETTLQTLKFDAGGLGGTSEEGNDKEIVFIGATDGQNVTLGTKAEVTGEDKYNLAIAMGAEGEGAAVTNTETLKVNDYALGLVAVDGAEAVINGDVEVDGSNFAIGMVLDNATGEIAKDKTLTVTNGTGVAATGEGNILNVNGTISASDKTAILLEEGDLTVNKGEEAEVTGNIRVIDGTLAYNGEVTDETFGVEGGNLTVEDITSANDTVVTYTADGKEAVDNKIELGAIVAGGTASAVKATLSNVNGSQLAINSGVITVTDGIGIEVEGKAIENGTTTATVTSTLGEIAGGTAVEVTGAKGNNITVNFENAPVVAAADGELEKTVISGIAADVTGAKDGKVTVNVNQENLQVAEGKHLVNVNEAEGSVVDVNITKTVVMAGDGSLVETASTGTTNVDLSGAKQTLTTAGLVNSTAVGTLNVTLGEVEGTGNVLSTVGGTVSLKGGETKAITLGNDMVGVNATGAVDVTTTGKIALVKSEEDNRTTGEGAILVKSLGDTTVINKGELSIGEGTVGLDVSTSKVAGTFKNDNGAKIDVDGTLILGTSDADALTVSNNGVITLGENGVLGQQKDNSAKLAKLTNSGQLTMSITEEQYKEIDKAVEEAIEKLGDKVTEEEKAATREKVYKEQLTKLLGTDVLVSGGILTATDGKNTIQTVAGEELSEYGDNLENLLGEKVNDVLKVTAVTTINADGSVVEGKTLNVTNKLTLTGENAEFTDGQWNLARTSKVGEVTQISLENDYTDFDGIITINKDMTQKVVAGTEPSTTKLEDNENAAIKVADSKTFAFEGTFTGVADSELGEGEKAEKLFYDLELGSGATFEARGVTTTSITANIKGDGTDGKFNVAEDSNVAYKGTMLDVTKVNVGENGVLTLDPSVTFAKNTGTKTDITTLVGNYDDGTADGQVIVGIANDGSNALLNSSKAENQLDFQNAQKGSVKLDISGLNGDTTIAIQDSENGATHTNIDGKLGTTSKFYGATIVGDNAIVKFDVEDEKTGNSKIDGVLEGIAPVAKYFETDTVEKLDAVYHDTVYAETVKMSMDTLRMNEDAVLSLNAKPEAGKWAAAGKALYSNTDYDREGAMRNYNVETETTGLMGAVEYGVNETTSVGFAFSGTKQDLDMKHGSADGDAFYFGAYANKEVGNIKLTAGLGYQINSIEADNNMLVATGDDYDSKAYSGFVQGKYILEAGEGFTVEPKAKLALTRLTQDSVKDAYFEMEEAKATTFDVEVGVDMVKTIALNKANLNLLAGVSYIRTMGDTDDKYEANFYNAAGAGKSFDVMGANLGENTLKLNVGAEVQHVNGFFYNGGASYRFDNEDRESFGLNLGAGYKF